MLFTQGVALTGRNTTTLHMRLLQTTTDASDRY